MEIVMKFENGEYKNNPAYESVTQTLTFEEFNEKEFDKFCTSFKEAVKKVLST